MAASLLYSDIEKMHAVFLYYVALLPLFHLFLSELEMHRALIAKRVSNRKRL